ncbi:MAG: patatin-like phospholipase family protein [Gammaproteobacteria bacterium]|nr:patatin-like phospholipase family protein [Gammaproteobacteria bacterium]
MQTKNQKSVSLILGGGGARGLAHIGIIRWLEENNYKIQSISGCSIGALIGGIYAAGKLDDFEQWVCAITKVDMVTLLDISWGTSGFVKGDKIINTLIELVGDQDIETLPIRFTAVASDLKGEKEVWINSGKLFDAIRASISLPFFFTPFRRNGVELIDGGVLNPVPIAPTFSDGTDMSIAVNLGGDVEHALIEKSVTDTPQNDPPQLHDKILNFINRFKEPNNGEGQSEWNILEIAHQAFDAMQGTIARQKLAAYPPDHTITIPRNICTILEFDRAAEMIELGYQRAKQQLGEG